MRTIADLSESEFSEVIKIAKNLAEKNGTSTKAELFNAFDAFEEQRIIRDNNLHQPVSEGIREYKDDGLNDYIKNNMENINKLVDAFNKIIESGFSKHDKNILRLALSGILSDEALSLSLDKIPDSLKPDYLKCIRTINTLTRENYYVHYVYGNIESIEDERQMTIEKYKQLQLQSSNVKTIKDARSSWSYYLEPLSLETQLKEKEDWRNSNLAMVYGSSGIKLQTPYVSNQSVKYDVTSFDNIYGLANEKITADDIDKDTFNHACELLSNNLEKIEGMSTEDYKNYKLAQMKLTYEEQKEFDKHFNEYTQSNDIHTSHSL